MVLAHFLRCGLKGFRERDLYLAFVVSAVAFFLTTPFSILDYPTFLADLQYEAKHYSTGHLGWEGNTLNWYLTYLLRVAGPIAILAVLETFRGVYARSKYIILLFSLWSISYSSAVSW
jgi:hypothetical protein